MHWGSILAGNLVVVAVIALLVVGIDRSLAAERQGLGLLTSVNVINVFDAASTWLLLGRGEAGSATVWLRRHRPAALLIPLAPLLWGTIYHLAGWVPWAR